MSPSTCWSAPLDWRRIAGRSEGSRGVEQRSGSSRQEIHRAAALGAAQTAGASLRNGVLLCVSGGVARAAVLCFFARPLEPVDDSHHLVYAGGADAFDQAPLAQGRLRAGAGGGGPGARS